MKEAGPRICRKMMIPVSTPDKARWSQKMPQLTSKTRCSRRPKRASRGDTLQLCPRRGQAAVTWPAETRRFRPTLSATESSAAHWLPYEGS